MEITFIRPHLMDSRSADAMEPLVFAILAGLTPKEFTVRLYDERLEPIPERLKTDLVAITVETFTARRAYQLAERFRSQGIPVILGGYHVSFMPEEALSYADSILIGDAEEVWGDVLVDLEKGALQKIYQAERQPPLSGLNYDRSIFAGKKYKKVVPVQYGRGCRFACDFCSIHAFYGFQTRQRPIAELVAEIKEIGERYILFVDDNLFTDLEQAKALFEALIPLDIQWACQVSIDLAQDESLLELMAKSGCFGALIGFESLDEDNLRQMKKGWNLKQGYLEAVNAFHERGIMIYASFMFGYDHDRVDSFAQTAQFAIEAGFALVNFSALMPTPGAKLYDRLLNEGRMIYPEWWLDPNYRYGDAVFRPLHMSPEQLTEGCRMARAEFYSYQSIGARGWANKTNRYSLARFGFYVAANLMTRKELGQKLGMPLGGRS